MYRKWQIFLGAFIVFIGLMTLVGSLADVNVWRFFWPLALIGLGVFILLRPQFVSANTNVHQRLLGEFRRRGDWQVTDEEIWLLIGDVEIDLTRATIPAGETTFRVFGFVGEVELYLPAGVGISVQSNAFLTDGKILREKYQRFLAGPGYTSPGYDAAERKIRLEANYFIADLKVKQVDPTD